MVGVAITFDQSDHPDYIPKPGRLPLVLDPIIGTIQLTKVLKDGGSGHNLLYLDAFVAMSLSKEELTPSPHPFYGVVPGN